MRSRYSQTPLAKKLSLKNGMRVWRHGMPQRVAGEIASEGLDLELLDTLQDEIDCAHLFVTLLSELKRQLAELLPLLRPAGCIWVSWPKKASKVPSDISEDEIRRVALPMGLVDVKVCAVDETWSGLKLVIRKEHRSFGGSG